MKKISLILISILTTIFITACATGKFSAIDGELPADQVVSLLADSDESSKITFSSVNGKAAAGASEAIAPAGEIKVLANYVRGTDKHSKELIFTAAGGQTYKIGFRSEDVEYKMGSKDTKHKVVLYVKDASGSMVAGSDAKGDMEFAVQ